MMFTGCGSNSTPPAAATPAPSAAAATDTSETSAPSDTGTASTAAAAGSDTSAAAPALDTSNFVTLQYIDVGDKGPSTDAAWAYLNGLLKQQLNCNVQITCLSWADWSEKYPLIFASGQNFDFCYSSSWTSYSANATQGSFYQLAPSDLQTYMPKTYAAVTQQQWDGAKVNGNIYMIPSTRPSFDGTTKNLFLFRGDLMQKYGISAINNEQDLLGYWDAVAADKSSGVTPFAPGNGGNGMSAFGTAFQFIAQQYFTPNYMSTFQYAGGQYDYFQCYDISNPANVTTVDQSDLYMQAYQTLRDWYQKGYFGSDVGTVTDGSDVAFQNGKSATMVAPLDNVRRMWQTVTRDNPSWNPQIVDLEPDVPATLVPASNNGVAISANSKYPQLAMAVIDLLGYDPQYTDAQFGVPGTDYTVNSDGSLTLNVDSQGIPTFQGTSGFMGIQTPTEPTNELNAPNYQTLLTSLTNAGITPATRYMNFDNTQIQTQISAVASIESTYLPQLNLGLASDIQGTYDTMMSQLNSTGLKDIQTAYLQQVQAFMTAYAAGSGQ